MNDPISRVVDVAAGTLADGESIVRITLADPLPASHADYFTRYKVKIAKVSGDASSISSERCIVVNVSSNFGTATIDPRTSCSSINDVG